MNCPNSAKSSAWAMPSRAGGDALASASIETGKHCRLEPIDRWTVPVNRKVHRGSDLVCHCDDRLRDGVRDMISELALVLVLLAAAIVMFAINKPRLDAVALIMLVALPFTGVLTMGEALAGFSDPNIVLIAALFVIGDGLVRTGVAQRLGDWLIAKAGKSEARLTVLLMVVVCSLGATMSSTAVTAIFIPVALRIAQSTGVGPGRLMMPLSFAALISGMTTLVATAPNLVVNSELERHGLPGFAFFSFTPFGLPVLALGILYMSFARRWLPAGSEAMGSGRTGFAAWVDEYQLADHERRLRVTEGSPLVGQTLANLDLRGSAGINIIAVEKSGRFAVRSFGRQPRLSFLLATLCSSTSRLQAWKWVLYKGNLPCRNCL